MQTTIHQDTGLTDEEMTHADEATRAFYLRVLMLVNDSGCTVHMAIEAVVAADEESH